MSIKYNGKLIAGKYKTQIVTDATESNKGLIRIATLEEVNTGTDNTTAVTPKGLATKQNKLTAGTGIEILPDGTINNTQTSAEWGNIQGDIINQSDLIDKFDKKQDVISDLENIRDGANKGSTSIQPSDLAIVATSGSYNDLTNKPIIPSAVTEATISGWGFTKNTGTVTSVTINGTAKNPIDGVVDLGTVITAHQDISGKQDVISDLATIREGASKGATALQSVPDEYVTETELNAKGYLTSYTETDPIYTADKPNIANTNLNNLSATGEKHFLNKSQITNCLLEVPQRIKLELNDGTLTLKAGSQVIVPNGFESDGTTPKFDEVVINNDISQTVTSAWGTGKHIICYNRTDNSFLCRIAHASGTSPSGDYTIYYNTVTNVVRDTNITDKEISLPIGFATVGNLAFTSIDQVFNGMGYIGSTIWVDKGVKGLIPNGRNEDDSLNNIEFTTDKLLTLNITESNRPDMVIFMKKNNTLLAWGRDGGYVTSYKTKPTNPSSVYQRAYIESENTWYHSLEQAVWLPQDDTDYITELFAVSTDNNAIITSFNPKLPFRAVDYNDVDEQLANKVSKSGDTMSGPLNFNESPVVHDFISNTNCYVQRTNRILSNADPVDSNIYVSGISIVDETNYEIAKTEIAKYKDGTIRHNFLVHNINGVGTGWASLGVGYKPNGTHITYAPTPPTGDNSTQIATTAWVKALPRLIETWESEWFTIAKSQSRSWNLASTGMNATNSIHIKPEIIAKVITAGAGYAVGDIVYGQWMNYVGSTGKLEQGSSLCFTGSTLTFSTGNDYKLGGVKKGGGWNSIEPGHVQLKIILRRFSS